MIERLRRMLAPRRTPTIVPEAVTRPSAELGQAKRRHRELMRRADVVIADAMAHADQVFTRGYRGPDRRSHPR